ncbi:MAG: hypothetical protein ACFFBD_13975, partial [Candidatus Hodarchaeota archaeon]
MYFALIIINPNIMLFIVYPERVLAFDYVNKLLPRFLDIILLTLGAAMILFSPSCFLSDAGLVYLNRGKVEETERPVDARSVGGWYHYLLRDYAGIGVILSYCQLT